MELFNSILTNTNSFLTGFVLIIALVGGGLWFTVQTGYVQVREFRNGWHRIFGGGIKRIANITEKPVPLMACFCLIGGLIIVLMNIQNVPYMFTTIIKGAFNPQAVCGGAFGVAMKEAVSKGVARGLFSNEAGMGSTPNAHARANVAHPCQQGQVAIVSVFIDTIPVLNMTAFVIIGTKMLEPGSAAYVNGELVEGITFTQTAFNSSFGSVFIAICMFFFALFTILGRYFFGETNIKYLLGKKAVSLT